MEIKNNNKRVLDFVSNKTRHKKSQESRTTRHLNGFKMNRENKKRQRTAQNGTNVKLRMKISIFYVFIYGSALIRPTPYTMVSMSFCNVRCWCGE